MIFFDGNEIESLKRFRHRGFRKFLVSYSIDQEKLVLRYFSVISSGKRNKLLKLLFNKWIWDELSQEEYSLLFSLPEFFQHKVVMSAFRALQLVSKKILRERIKKLDSLIGIDIFLDHNSYYGMLGNLLISFSKGERKLPRTQKYSGYTRHYKDHGSLRIGSFEEPLSLSEDEFCEENFFYEYFVGMIVFP